MALSCPDSTSLVDSELDQLYGNGSGQSLLPAAKVPASDRDASGRFTANAVQTILSNLTNTGVIPVSAKNDTALLEKKQATFLQNVKQEYCFYYARYKYALTKLLEAIRQGYSESTPDKKQLVAKYLAYTQSFNQKLNDLVQLTDAITATLASTTPAMDAGIQQMNQQLQDQKEKLAQQQKMINSGEAAKKLSKDMVRYTEEKGRYTDNLLTLYSALNIVALGLLVYVYKSSAD